MRCRELQLVAVLAEPSFILPEVIRANAKSVCFEAVKPERTAEPFSVGPPKLENERQAVPQGAPSAEASRLTAVSGQNT